MKLITVLVLMCCSIGATAADKPKTDVFVYPLWNDVQSTTRITDGNQHTVSYFRAAVIVSDRLGESYTIRCIYRWKWNSCHELKEAKYAAEFDKSRRHLTVWGQWEGNQKPWGRDKFEVIDIRPINPAPTDEAGITELQDYIKEHPGELGLAVK